MKDSIDWEKDLAICNDTANEIMTKFWDRLLEEKVELPEGAEIFSTRNVISKANNE